MAGGGCGSKMRLGALLVTLDYTCTMLGKLWLKANTKCNGENDAGYEETLSDIYAHEVARSFGITF